MQSQTQGPGPASSPVMSPRSHRHRFLVAVAVAAVLACGAAAGWVARAASTEPPQGLAPAHVTKMLDSRIDAVNGDVNVASFYGPHAVLEEQDQHPPVVTRGSQAISDHLTGYHSIGFGIAPRRTVAIELGSYVAEGLEWSTGGGIVVYQLDQGGKIVHQWVIGGTP